GYDTITREACGALLSRAGLKRQDSARVPCYAPDPRLAPGILRALKSPDTAMLRLPLLASVGNTGTASPLLTLAAALEEAQPGDRVLVVGYGSGADALLFQATERIEGLDRRRGVTAPPRAGRPTAP